jgi:ribosome-associated protein
MPDPEDFTPEDTPAYARPSKTRLKKAMHDLQDLGEELVKLPQHHLDRLVLSDPLRDALEQWRRTRSHEGRRRQMQYIGKVMRNVDPEPLREAVAAFKLGGARDALALHQAERWRADLLADDEALTRWVQAHPDADVQHLRALIRAARKDAAGAPEQRSGRGFRELFQFIKQGLAASGAGSGEEEDGDAA